MCFCSYMRLWKLRPFFFTKVLVGIKILVLLLGKNIDKQQHVFFYDMLIFLP